MTVRDDRGDVKQTTAGFRVLLMVQSLTSAKSKFLSLVYFRGRSKGISTDYMLRTVFLEGSPNAGLF